MDRVPYDELSMFHENAEEWAIPYASPPTVARVDTEVAPGRRVSALRWGSEPPSVVLLHGGGQNAHTYDTVALALGRPLLAIDLPGHGHSDLAPRGMSDVDGHGRDVVAAMIGLGVAHVPLIGMSLGGLVALRVAGVAPDAVSRLGLIDVLPGLDRERAKHITDFIDGPTSFASLDDLVARTIAHNPTRSEQSLRRGVLHNAEQLEDGSWRWRHQRHPAPDVRTELDPGELWEAIDALHVPFLLVRGMAPGSLLDDADEARLLQHCPTARIVRVEGAGHSVQGDQPVVLASVLASFLDA